MQERNPEPREPNSFIISSKHACPLLQTGTLYLPGLFAMQTFLKRWSGTKHSLPLLARHEKLQEPHGELFPNVFFLSVLLHLGKQIPFLYFFWFGFCLPVSSVVRQLSLLGALVLFEFCIFSPSGADRTDILLQGTSWGLPQVKFTSLFGGLQGNCPWKTYCHHLFSSRKVKTNCRQFRQSN